MSEVKKNNKNKLCGLLPIIQRFCLRKELALKYNTRACESIQLYKAIEKKRKGCVQLLLITSQCVWRVGFPPIP